MKQDLQGSAESKSLKSQNEKEEKRAFKADYNSSDGPNTASTANSLKDERRSNLANFTTFKTSETRTRTTKNPRKKIKKFHDKERVARNPRYCQSNQLIAEQQSAHVSTWPNQNSSNSYRQRRGWWTGEIAVEGHLPATVYEWTDRVPEAGSCKGSYEDMENSDVN